MCVGHATSEFLFRIGPGVSYGVRVPVQEGEDEAENRWETLARMRTKGQCLMKYPVPVYSTVQDRYNYDRVLYSSPEEAAAAQTLYKFFLRYTRYFT